MLFSIFRGRSLLPVCFSLSSRRPLRCAKNGASLLSSALSTLYSQRRTREYHLGVSARTRAYGNLRSSLPGCIVRVPEQTNSYSTYLGETDARS